MIKTHSITNKEYQESDLNFILHFGFHPTPYGQSLIGISKWGIVALNFVLTGNEKAAVQAMKNDWAKSTFLESPEMTQTVRDKLFKNTSKQASTGLELFVKGTPFQIRVWKELLRVSYGSVAYYQEIARRIGHPKAFRAVGSAIAQNRIAYLIPCHRVIQKSGDPGQYRWGKEMKKELLDMESSSLSV
ncbi:MAG: methylated-DNA--[protein]-cysteine S-methyltransferase [Nitrospiria bacterium]